MAELKRKVTLKRKGEPMDDNNGKGKGEGNGKNKLLLPLIIVGLLVLVIGGYLLLKPGSEKPLATSAQDTTQTITPEAVTDAANSDTLQPVAQEQSPVTEPGKENAAGSEATASPVQPKVQQPNKPQANTNQPQSGKSIAALPYKKGEAYKIYQFPFGVSDYSQPNPELDKLAEIMKQNPNLKISISAFTDNVGDADFNQALSDKRAKAINDYLVSKGIGVSRLSFHGKGISTQYPTNAENRRAEFTLSE